MATNGGQGRRSGGSTQYCYPVVDGEAGFFPDMFGGRCSRPSGDLFDLVWQGRWCSSMEYDVHPGGLPSPLPPSEDEMAAWLYPIVRGEEPGVVPSDLPGHATMVGDDYYYQQQAAPVAKGEKPPNMEDNCFGEDPTNYSSEGRKKASGGARRAHHSETHNLTEKRRRCKINERFKTLQQLIPGCDDKSNQASTLDQTIQYMKALQQQIQAMSFGSDGSMRPAAAVYPVMPPAAIAPGIVLAPHPAMVPFGPMLPLGHHPAVMVHAPAPMLYPAVASMCKGSSTQQKAEE